MYLVLYLFIFFIRDRWLSSLMITIWSLAKFDTQFFILFHRLDWWKRWSYAIIEWTSLDRSAQYKSKNHIALTSETMICLLASKIKKKGICKIEDEQQNYSNWSNSLFISETHVNGGYIVSIERERRNYIALLTMKLNISCPSFAIGSTRSLSHSHTSLSIHRVIFSTHDVPKSSKIHNDNNFIFDTCI